MSVWRRRAECRMQARSKAPHALSHLRIAMAWSWLPNPSPSAAQLSVDPSRTLVSPC